MRSNIFFRPLWAPHTHTFCSDIHTGRTPLIIKSFLKTELGEEGDALRGGAMNFTLGLSAHSPCLLINVKHSSDKIRSAIKKKQKEGSRIHDYLITSILWHQSKHAAPL